MKSSYYVILPVRNCGKSLERVMDSLIHQVYPPEKINVVDDGSTDETSEILSKFQKTYPDKIKIFQLKSTKRDYGRMPLLYNTCLDKEYDYHLIAGGDSIFDIDYAKKILLEFEKDSQIAIASGYYDSTSRIHFPMGEGRFVKQDYFFRFYDKYTNTVGFEDEVVYKAMTNGYKTHVFKNARYEHVDKLGHKHKFTVFGHSMRSLGYHPLYVLGRTFIEFVKSDHIGKRGTCNMFWKYLTFKPEKTGHYTLFPKEERQKIREYQKNKMKTELLKLFGK